MRTPISIALGLLAAAAQANPATPEATAQLSPAVKALLERAQLWEDRNRIQLARETLEKLLRTSPEHPEALAALARLEARADRPAMARAALDRLRKVAPAHPAIAGVEMQIRLAGPERNKLLQIRQMAKQARQQDRADLRQKALAAYRELFGGAKPEGDLALEYWQFVADDWNAWDEAQAGLADLVARHPDNLRYRYVLAEHETTRLPMSQSALQILIDMTKLPEFERQARAAWRRALLRLDATTENIALIEEYLQREASDSGMQERRKTLIADLETKKRQPAAPAPAGNTPAPERPASEGLALLEKGEIDAAELQLERELRTRPDDAELIGGMGLVRLRQGHHAQAQAYFQQARRIEPQTEKWQSLLDTARFWGLLREAGDARSSREYVLAEDKLREAMKINAREPQAVIALARVQSDRQQMAAAETSYRAALQLDPVNRNALGELLELMIRDGRREDARQAMAALTPAQRTALGRDLDAIEAGMLRAEADMLIAAGRRDEALVLLEKALPLDPDNVWLRYDLGRLLVVRNEAARAFALFDPLLAREPQDAAARYALALLQSAADRELDALMTLEQVKVALRDDKLTRFQRELWLGLQLQLARSALQGKRLEQARRLLDEAEQALGADAALLPRLAQGWSAAGEHRRALALIGKLPGARPLTGELALIEAEILADMGDIESLRLRMAAVPELAEQPTLLNALAQTEIRHGNFAAAEPLLRRLMALQPEREDIQIDLFDLMMALERQGEALELLDALHARLPGDPRVLLRSGRMALAAGRVDEAIHSLQLSYALDSLKQRERTGQVMPSLDIRSAPTGSNIDAEIIGLLEVPLPADDDTPIKGDYQLKQLAGMIDQRAGWLSAGIDQRERVGTPGVSQYFSQEAAFEALLPQENGDRWLVRGDTVRLDAGRLDRRETGDVDSFGSLALCARTVQGCPRTGRLTAEGTGLAVGWQRRDLKVDLGTTPLDFPVTNWVGGIADKGDIGDFSWSAELSRRPLTGSLLSWAGARDPNTGRIWGGMVASGMRLGLSHDKGGALGFWSSLGLHALTGKNVEDNRRLQLMAGGYWRVVNRENHLLSLGLTGMHWASARNVGEYTFGHGGYYSPASYQSLALPISWSQRFARFSYQLRAAATVSQAKTDAALYYPTDAILQARAVGLGIDPSYAASPDNSPSTRGWSFHMGWEYQLDPQLFLGGRIEIERSGAYAPDRYQFFLRYNLDRPAAQPVRLPPEPFVPYSQF